MKVCKDCQEEKSATEFYTRKDSKDGLYSRCKPCHIKISNKNKPDYREKNKNKLRDYNFNYWQENKLTYRDSCRTRAREWYVNNRGRAIASVRGRETKRKQATPKWLTKSQVKEIESVYTLAKDCSVTSGELYEVDHIVPLQGENVCGLHVPWNLQVLPMDVNRMKSNKHESDFHSPTTKGITP